MPIWVCIVEMINLPNGYGGYRILKASPTTFEEWLDHREQIAWDYNAHPRWQTMIFTRDPTKTPLTEAAM